MENVGLVDATALLFTAPLPEGLDLVSFSIDGVPGDIDGNPVDAGALETGVRIGDVDVDIAREIEIVVEATGEPDGDAWLITPGWGYDYISCVGEDALTEPHGLPDVVIDYIPDAAETTGGDESSGGGEETSDSDSDSNSGSASITVTVTDSDSDTDGDGDSDSLSGGLAEPNDGCGCRSQGPAGAFWSLALLGLAFLRRRRA
jgi:MYXO-CTERM domain-containing protein